MSTLPRRVLVAPIRFYQRAVSPLRMPTCRFYPTCSQYALESIERHGAVRGMGYAMIRLLKCGPWHPGGVDKVPARRTGRRDKCDEPSADQPLCAIGVQRPEDLDMHRQPGVI